MLSINFNINSLKKKHEFINKDKKIKIESIPVQHGKY